MPQFTGTVRWFNSAKGYGFLGRSDGGPDVFAHFSSIRKSGYKTLKEGESVTFDIVKGEKGLQADNVTPVSATGISIAPPPPTAVAPRPSAPPVFTAPGPPLHSRADSARLLLVGSAARR